MDDYKGRNPGEGTHKDLDGEFENFAAGKKEIYYLDKIETQTHVALFKKSPRLDGREVIDLKEGGFQPKQYLIPGKQECLKTCCYQDIGCDCEPCEGLPDDAMKYDIPRPSLRLDAINLFNYTDYIAEHTSDDYIIKAITFDYDYILASGTPNSYSDDNSANTRGKLTLLSLNFLGKKGIGLIPPIDFKYKNIPYEKNNGEVKVDTWGYYKSDFETEYIKNTNNTIGRFTTPVSALDVDAWSLNEIVTALGSAINITYESDEFNTVVHENQQILRTKNITDFGQGKLKITFWENVDLSIFLKEGLEIGLDLVGTYLAENASDYTIKGSSANQEGCQYIPPVGARIDQDICFTAKGIIENVFASDGYIIVNAPDYYNKLKYETKTIITGASKRTKDGQGCNFYTTQKWMDARAYPEYFPAGIISFPRISSAFGGGIRVKSISIGDRTRTTHYEYENGTTTYEPYEITEPAIDPIYKKKYGECRSAKLAYKQGVMKHFSAQLNISRHLPGPGVLYQKVRVKESILSSDDPLHALPLPNYTEYEFETYKHGMVNVKYGPVSKSILREKLMV